MRRLACATATLLLATAPARAQTAEEAQPPASMEWTLRDRLVVTGLSASFPGAGQFVLKRYTWAYVHGGGAVALGAVGGLGWLVGNGALQWTGIVGLTALSVYSAADAYLSEPAQGRNR